MHKLLLLSSGEATANRFISLAQKLFPDLLDVCPCSSPEAAYALMESEDFDSVAYEAEGFNPAAFPKKDIKLLPMLSLKARAMDTVPGGGLFLDLPLDEHNFAATVTRFFSENQGEGGYMNGLMSRDFQQFLKERFWRDVILGIIVDPAPMAAGIGMEQEQLEVLPVLIEIKEWQSDANFRERTIITSHIRTVAERMLLNDPQGGVVIQVKDDIMVALRQCTGDPPVAQLTEDCLSFCDECSRLFSVSLCCSIGEITDASGLSDMFEALVDLSRENIVGERLLFLRFGVFGKTAPMREPDITQWRELLQAGEYDQMLISVAEYFMTATASNRLSFENLRRISHDFQQMFYVVLHEKGVAAHVVFDNEKYDTLWDDAADSVSELLNWIFWSANEISKYLGSVDSRQDKLGEILDFIKSNLGRELTRQELAGRIHLSQSALARMFKAGTGMTITEYIFNERLQTAKRLLATTAMPIGEVSDKCGFRNYSYFYTRFKKALGQSPSEYRQSSRATPPEMV